MELNSLRNITRFTYEYTAFLGWRLAICRKQKHFIRYFSDRQYGGEKAALEAALAARAKVLEQLVIHPDDPATAFELAQKAMPPSHFPSGLSPLRARVGSIPSGH